MLRILVTGGAGFIGSHIVDAFVAAGHEVAVVDSFWSQGGGRRANLNPKATLHELDIRDAKLIDVFTGFRPHIVSHHAAQHSVSISTKDPFYDADVNVRGLLNVLTAADKTSVKKVIFASSAATYGAPQYLPIDEVHPQVPQSPYGITKMVAEHYLRYFCTAGTMRFTALRYGNVYGPRQDPNGEAGVIAIFSEQILKGSPIRIDWDGEQQKDYVYVGDVAAANVQALERADAEAINIGTAVGTSVNELHRLIARAVGRDVDVVAAAKRPGDVYRCIFAVEKADRELGWKPKTDLVAGIATTTNYFRSASTAPSA
ncbi:MAG: UDP-glucose 4-epimerase [Candidatus Eremiobacter antarcticus]|nr:NAD-dependent epimerase/dehydratase family protein [Candidatus Eremiobacteraeota bacterium]MBC5806977.1 NAD-dependent epimerase/dehydratase family protein [Candidatus Eremiobacteraeota bacterium]PZR62623.1 MAG: UDP-glucose 4-epimerase [Candidatus Eremiobacter sp. RRmetagenome_bin22]